MLYTVVLNENLRATDRRNLELLIAKFSDLLAEKYLYKY